MNLFRLSFYGTVMIAIILLLRVLFINKLPKKVFMILWEITLIRLLVPFTIPFKFSLYSLTQNKMNNIDISKIEPVIPALSPALEIENDVSIPLQIENKESISIWFITWLAGFTIILLYFLFLYVKCYRNFKMSLPIDNSNIDKWLNEHKIKRLLEIRQSEFVSSPISYGVIKPVILLPKNMNFENVKIVNYILEHEYVHIKRFDIIRKVVMLIAICFHWFNPLVWIMSIFFNQDIELVCDETVVFRFGENRKSDYAKALINMEEIKSGFIPFYNGFSKNAIEERVRAIMKTRKKTIGAVILGVLIIIMIVVIFATSSDNNSNKESISYAAIIMEYSEDYLITDVVEFVTDDDTERKKQLIEELNLKEGFDLADGNFLNGYYIYNINKETVKWKIDENTEYNFIDWNNDFTELHSSDSLLVTTKDKKIFIEYLKTYNPYPKMPFFFEIEGNYVKSITEKPLM